MSRDVKQLIAQHDEAKKQAFENCIVADNNGFEVIDEACLHLLEHYTQPCKTDYVFFMGKSCIGRRRDNNIPCDAQVSYIDGDLHGFAHDLCSFMKDDVRLRAQIIHAVELFLNRRI